jgi:hypothetical protein
MLQDAKSDDNPIKKTYTSQTIKELTPTHFEGKLCPSNNTSKHKAKYMGNYLSN